ncbi:DUF4232 domain-containing protein [Streptomyces sp. CHD11]|uniref:DUF4232 domain-containing protein n=1 Tax=Streptomyces sp. CHD11 TaxID=2741325 RepID=UPI001BFC7A91|nr:DUF4232 domain-containing protein [Streptomyces sp. CHD11]MBT3149778.1 DUF4232 domain-containing protein [Streptomyces sp. CHD11]
MRASRLRLLAAAGITLATLALTACEDGTGTVDEGASQPSAPAAPDQPASPSADDTTSDQPSQAGTDPEKGTGTDGAKDSDNDPENRVACNGSNTAVTARPVPRPLNHMLITVKNTGSKLCDLTYYPVLRFDEMQWAPQPFEESKPQAVVSLQPGETAYAGALLSAADGSGDGGTTGRKLAVGFHGRTPNSDGGPSALPSLPAEGVYYDSSLTVTYWQRSMQDALTY